MLILTFVLLMILGWLAFINCEVVYHRNKMRKRYGQRNYDWLRKYLDGE